MTTNTLHEITPDTKIWGCPKCDKVGVSIAKDQTVIQCPTPDCTFKWLIKGFDFAQTVKSWNTLIVAQTQETSKLSKWEDVIRKTIRT